jgi:hypothetical protein
MKMVVVKAQLVMQKRGGVLLRISLICAFGLFFSLPNGVRRSTFDAGLVTKFGAFSSFHQYSVCHSRQDIDYLY